MPYPCCCKAVCGEGLVLTISGVTNGTCSDCADQFNTSHGTDTGTLLGFFGVCSLGATSTHCFWGWGSTLGSCFDAGDSLVAMFEDSGGQKYIAVQIQDDDIGGLGANAATWIKPITDYTLPQTLNNTHLDCGSSAKCNFSNAVVVVSG